MNDLINSYIRKLPEDIKKIYDDLMKKIHHAEFTLPRLPELVSRIDNILADENASLSQVVDVIRIDPVLCARIIQIANSPLVRGSQKITTLSVAAHRIGLNFVRNLVFCMSMHDRFTKQETKLHKYVMGAWDHSVRVMMYSHALAKKFKHLKPDVAMTAGILHDIGALPLYDYANEHNILDEEEVRKLIHYLHVPLSVEILTIWDMEELFVEVAMWHRDIYNHHTDEITYADIVTLADCRSCNGCIDHCNNKKVDWDRLVPLKKIGMSREELMVVFDEAESEIEEIQKAMFS